MALKRPLISVFALLMLANVGVHSIGLSFGDITELLNFARETTTGMFEAVEWTRQSKPEDHEYDFPFIKRMERRLINHISTVSRKINSLEENMEVRSAEIITTIIHDLPLRNRLDRNLHEMTTKIGQVDSMFQDYADFADKKKKFEEFTLRDFAQTSVHIGTGGLPDLLKSIHRLVVPTQLDRFDNSILVLLAQNTKEAVLQICNEQQSPQQLLYNLYNTIALTEMKGFAMMQFSYTLLQLYNNGTFNEEIKKTNREYELRTSETLRAVKTAMAFAPRDLWRCDPSVHEEGSTYVELKQLFQGYVVNEVDLSPTATCKENCGYYSFASVNRCYDNLFCSQQRRCNGKVLNCQYIDSDMWICPSEKYSQRRYEYIQYENGRQFGNKGTCTKGTTKVDSWWRWLFWHCSYCMCFCDDHNSSSDRYFSLKEATSDVDKNRIITGLRLTKVNQIIHLQIQEGELLPRAGIVESTVHWKNIDNFTVLDRNVENGRDYHTLAWERRAIDLDDLVAPESHLLTGVRFRLVGTHLNFEIRVTRFNFTTGMLIKPSEKNNGGHWLSNDNTDVKDATTSEKARTEFKLKNPDIPTRSRAPALPDSRSNQYLNFGATDLEKDAAQTTIPFLDTQPVITKPAFPLSGAGVFHKGHEGSGGFVALRVVTYDFTKHLQADAPPQTPLIPHTRDITRTSIGINEIPSV